MFLAPSLAGITVFVLVPFLGVILRAFSQAMGGQFVGFENFFTVWKNEAFRLAVKNTTRFIVTCIPLLMVFSLGTALMLYDWKEGSGLYKTTILLPMAIPVASVVLLWKLVFWPQGLLNQFLAIFGMQAQDFMGQKSAFTVLVVTYIWKNMGYGMILWLAGLGGIALELYEAAKVDGAGAIQRFIYITIPELKNTAFLVIVLSVLNSFRVFREAYLIAGDYPNESIYMLQHLFNNWFTSLDIQKMSAASVMLETIVLLPFFVFHIDKGRRR